MNSLCPFKMAGNYAYLGCHIECAINIRGKCAIAVLGENCLDDIEECCGAEMKVGKDENQ